VEQNETIDSMSLKIPCHGEGGHRVICFSPGLHCPLDQPKTCAILSHFT